MGQARYDYGEDDERPTPAVGQFWQVGNDSIYLRSWDKDRREFRAMVRNQRGYMTVTPEFLLDAKYVRYLKPIAPTPRQLRDAANRPWER